MWNETRIKERCHLSARVMSHKIQNLPSFYFPYQLVFPSNGMIHLCIGMNRLIDQKQCWVILVRIFISEWEAAKAQFRNRQIPDSTRTRNCSWQRAADCPSIFRLVCARRKSANTAVDKTFSSTVVVVVLGKFTRELNEFESFCTWQFDLKFGKSFQAWFIYGVCFGFLHRLAWIRFYSEFR